MIAGSNKVTPEEKLLHIIENSPEAHKLSLKKNRDKTDERPGGFHRADAGASFAFLSRLNPKNITLRGMNKLFIGIALAATIVLIYYYVEDMRNSRVNFVYFTQAAENMKSPFLPEKERSIPPVSQYLADAEKNNPFHIIPVVEAPRKKIKQELNLKLVGILWSDRPQAVLEDEITQKNFMVYEGDTVDKFTVEKITANDVLLVSQEGETTLK